MWFWKKHLEKEEFDEATRVEVENKVETQEQTNSQEADEPYCLNRNIT